MKSADNKELNYQFKTNINMKTKTSILAVTKAFFILLVSCCLFSCGNEQPVLNGKTPFVVTEIKEFNETHASYYGKCNTDMGTRNNFFGSWYPRIVLPKGYYNIGDTIKFADPRIK